MREGTNKEQERFGMWILTWVRDGWTEDDASLVCSIPSERRCLEGFCSADVIPSSHRPRSLADDEALSPQLEFASSELFPELLQ